MFKKSQGNQDNIIYKGGESGVLVMDDFNHTNCYHQSI